MDQAQSTEQGSPSAGQGHPPSVPRACDACRARKIRCNRESPCAHCLHAKIQCTQTEARPKEKRARILLTHQYEQKIDHIDRRLEGVLQLLREIKTQLPPNSTRSPETVATIRTAHSSTSPASQAGHVNHRAATAATGTMVEGDSSMTAHSVFANDLVHKAMGNDSRPEIRDRLDTLGRILEAMKRQPAAHEMTYPHARPVPPPAIPSCEMPPIEKTLQVLKLAKSEAAFALAWIYEFFDMDRFAGACLSVYMADNNSEFRPSFITVNVVLHYIFWACTNLVPDQREDYFGYSRLCGVNAETALSSLPLHLPADDEVIVALSLGAIYAIEISKPSLAWVLSSKASELCQTLGYHRVETYTNVHPDAAQYKQFLFWIVYTMDKGLCLRLGRSSTIQDIDVTAPAAPVGDSDTSRSALNSCFAAWVATAKVQGQIYELLYCPDALAQPRAVRQSRAQLLLKQLEELNVQTLQASEQWKRVFEEAAGSDLTKVFVTSDCVLRLSLVTLVHRAVPNPPGSPTTFTEECIRAARATLDRHQDCIAVLERNKVMLFSSYMNWTILFAPFVPFIVLFCQIIETGDRADLARLQAFVESLNPDHDVPEPVAKLCRLFQALYSIASHYVLSQAATGREEQQRANAGVDTYLAVLGFPPQPASLEGQGDAGYRSPAAADASVATNQEYQRGVNPVLWMANGAQLEDWFYNNQQMMTLLEDGFTADFENGWVNPSN
ncbi:hypothetical protein VTK26DRAFT_3876 [Humicola hyalothermophila]